MRNSSLADFFSADNITGLKHSTEAAKQSLTVGRGAFRVRMKVDRKNGWTKRK